MFTMGKNNDNSYSYGNDNSTNPSENITELTLLQKIALEGEVSTQYDTCLHESDKILKTYFVLNFVPKEQREWYLKECAKYVSLEVLDNCMKYVNREVFPISFVTDKLIDDLLLCLHKIDSCSRSATIVPMSETTLKSKFVFFVSELITVSPRTAKEFLYAVLLYDDTCLDFLKDVSFSIKESIPEDETDMSDKEIIGVIKLLQTSLFNANILSFSEELNRVKEDKQNKVSSNIGMFIKSLLNDMIEDEELSTNIVKEKVYVVNKIKKSSGSIIPLKKFTSQTEAIKFVKSIGKDYPEILECYRFEIVVENNIKGE